eukprot:105724-Chlamydomonas_euryale.AAC.1
MAELLNPAQLPAETADWDTEWATLIGREGADTWPIVLVTFFYVRQDLSSLGAAGDVVRLFMELVLDDIALPYFEEFALLPLPRTLRDRLRLFLQANVTTAGGELEC